MNGETQPSLQVEKLNSNSNGGIALWVGDNSAGSFANLKIDNKMQLHLVALLIALLTVSFQSIKAAVANPVKSLRME